LAQHLGERFYKKFDFLDFVVGTHNIHLLPEIVSLMEIKRQRITKTEFHNSLDSLGIYVQPKSGVVSAFVSIMQGCNNFCSYCVVPYLRGPEMSRPVDDVIDEVKKLADDGVREVTLLGQNVNSYGKTLTCKLTFPSLIRRIAKISEIKRIRFTTSHPRDLSEELMDCFAQENKLCQHIHLPVQSGSDRILKLMNRGYDAQQYIGKVEKLRKIAPQISITSDIIVGFPGETQKDYQETIDMMEEIKFDLTFSFKYSDREGTVAKSLKDKVADHEKLRRLQKLQALQEKHTLEKSNTLIGTIQEILVEGTSKNSDKEIMGRTSSWKIVNFEGSKELMGRLVNVRITNAYSHSLRGKIIATQGGYQL